VLLYTFGFGTIGALLFMLYCAFGSAANLYNVISENSG